MFALSQFSGPASRSLEQAKYDPPREAFKSGRVFKLLQCVSYTRSTTHLETPDTLAPAKKNVSSKMIYYFETFSSQTFTSLLYAALKVGQSLIRKTN